MKTNFEMAREAGFSTHHEMIWIDTWEVGPCMQRFAELIRADEREACAKVCEDLGMATNGMYERNHECAEAIRARGLPPTQRGNDEKTKNN